MSAPGGIGASSELTMACPVVYCGPRSRLQMLQKRRPGQGRLFACQVASIGAGTARSCRGRIATRDRRPSGGLRRLRVAGCDKGSFVLLDLRFDPCGRLAAGQADTARKLPGRLEGQQVLVGVSVPARLNILAE